MARVGVLALQGGFEEHQRCFEALGSDVAQVVQVRTPDALQTCDGLVIPGGESTVIAKLMERYQITQAIRDFAEKKPVWGTCAGCILLAKQHQEPFEQALSLIDIDVARNAYGRQLASFEAPVLWGDTTIPGVFIRAPKITAVGEDVKVLGQLEDGEVVACEQGLVMVSTFHPELTDNLTLQRHFLEKL